ncbi:MAG TPA: DNA-processing protein DprA [Alphaproteobacteria bacterium]|nr:DNA-processing protein DprA [Alphaproteobacteria bacterium]
MGAPAREIVSDAERIAALRLARSGEIGPITFRNLIERFGSALAAVSELPSLATQGGRAGQIRLAGLAHAEQELEAARAFGAEMLIYGEIGYPKLLAASEGAPSVIFMRGEMQMLVMPAVAIVGARNASANGRKLAESLAAGLGARGIAIASGLARGIDAAAHRGALKTGTLAVIAGGIDQIYPEENAELYEAICETGLIISEMPFGHIARAQDFPRRNRIIAGLARGTVVVEAAERSGSLITARLAGEMGREVFAVPGSPLDARCRGTNGLIKEGATLVETVDDILDNLPEQAAEPASPLFNRNSPHPASTPARPRADPKPAQRPDSQSLANALFELLGPSPVSIDELVRQTGAAASDIQTALLDLEIDGLILRLPGQLVSRVRPG